MLAMTNQGLHTIRTVVIPAAGLGTRSLPASKAVPKEVLPVVDKPLIQYAIEEALSAGIERVVLVLSPGKDAVVSHFCRKEILNHHLRRSGKSEALDSLSASELPDGALITVFQQEPMGLGHAIGCARSVVGDEPFAVMLPDDLILSDIPVMKQMVDAYAAAGGRGHMLAAQTVLPSEVHKYGILEVDTDAPSVGVMSVTSLVEKPDLAHAPSRLGVVGRYIFEPTIFEAIASQGGTVGGEIQLTDAICSDIVNVPVHGYRFDGARFDCGSAAGFVQANIAFGRQHHEVGPAIDQMLASGRPGIAAAAS